MACLVWSISWLIHKLSKKIMYKMDPDLIHDYILVYRCCRCRGWRNVLWRFCSSRNTPTNTIIFLSVFCTFLPPPLPISNYQSQCCSSSAVLIAHWLIRSDQHEWKTETNSAGPSRSLPPPHYYWSHLFLHHHNQHHALIIRPKKGTHLANSSGKEWWHGWVSGGEKPAQRK